MSKDATHMLVGEYYLTDGIWQEECLATGSVESLYDTWLGGDWIEWRNVRIEEFDEELLDE